MTGAEFAARYPREAQMVLGMAAAAMARDGRNVNDLTEADKRKYFEEAFKEFFKTVGLIKDAARTVPNIRTGK